MWARQRHVNALRSALREFYPARWPPSAPSWTHADALAVLGTPRPRPRAASLRLGHLEAAPARRRPRGGTSPPGPPRSWRPCDPRSSRRPRRSSARLRGDRCGPWWPLVVPQRPARGARGRVDARFESPPGRRDPAQPARAGAGARGPGAGRVRGRPDALPTAKAAEGLRRHRPDHQRLGEAAHRPGPGRPQPPPGRRLLPVGLLRPPGLAGGAGAATTPTGPAARPTTRPCGRWPTGWSASSTAASPTATATAKK